MSGPQRPSGGAPVVGLRRRPPAALRAEALPRMTTIAVMDEAAMNYPVARTATVTLTLRCKRHGHIGRRPPSL